MMHVLITDSGVGGLSVVAYAERFIREHGFSEPVRLTFANAAPENDYGYNSMPSREAKIETFDRFLRNVAARYAPDLIYVACNTLSVLLTDTPYFRETAIPIRGIVETGASLLLQRLETDPAAAAMIFATQTTIDAGAYLECLERRGIDPLRIISQACPGLADIISEDREGTRTQSEIDHWVASAIEKIQRKESPVVACLACTHYGYRKAEFAASLAKAGISATIVNPNESAIVDIFGDSLVLNGGANDDVTVEFVTRYAIPVATVEALSFFLSEISPRTVAAMRNYVQIPDLF